MRLTCPNCGAQYEIPDKVIPPQGRDLQCSNCDNSWFFANPDAPPHHEPGASQAPPAHHGVSDEVDDRPAQTPPRRKLDPTVSEILRQEAEREAQLRRNEASGAPHREPSQVMAPFDDASEPGNLAASARATQPTATTSATNRLPDLEEIGSTLRAADNDVAVHKSTKSKGGFSRGFAVIVLIAALLALAYFNARTITEAYPPAAPYMETYVAKVDEARVWLDGLITQYMPPPTE